MRALLACLFALVLGLGAGCGDDDDDATGAGAGSGGDTTEEGVDGSGALDPDDAREAGNPEVYERIESLTDCDELERERTTYETNAENRAEDPERQSILLAYAEAAEDRMAELDC